MGHKGYKTEYHITPEELKALVDYDPETGIFTWKERDGSHRGDKIFNAKVAPGTVAGNYKNNGYLALKIRGKVILAHRAAIAYVEGEWPDSFVDHLNGVRDDNRYLNLRKVSKSINQKNQKMNCRNTSGTMGVFYHSRDKRWQSSISDDNLKVHLGYFSTYAEAVNARKEAELLYGYCENHGRTP